MFTLIDKHRELWETKIPRALTQWVMSLWATHAGRQAGTHTTHTHKGREMYGTCTQRKTYNSIHITSTHRRTLAITQNNLCPLALHFAVSLCLKSHSQLWWPLRIKREGINKQANCGRHSPLCHGQETSFTMDTDRR